MIGSRGLYVYWRQMLAGHAFPHVHWYRYAPQAKMPRPGKVR
jgi:hypothetical protein